jgi:hypothetical protein
VVTAYVLIQTEVGKAGKVAGEATEINGVQHAYPLTGPYDVIVRAEAGNIDALGHAPDRPVAQLVFAMAPVALVLTTHLLMQQAGWRQPTRSQDEPLAAQQAGPEPAHPHRSGNHRTPQPTSPDQDVQVGARARVRAAYEAQVQAGRTPTGAGLARAAGVSERYGQRLLAEFTASPAPGGHPNGDHLAARGRTDHDSPDQAEGRRP